MNSKNDVKKTRIMSIYLVLYHLILYFLILFIIVVCETPNFFAVFLKLLFFEGITIACFSQILPLL